MTVRPPPETPSLKVYSRRSLRCHQQQDTSHDDLSLGVDATVEDELGHAARGTPSEHDLNHALPPNNLREGEVVVAVAHAPLVPNSLRQEHLEAEEDPSLTSEMAS
jgi:hypothetical protein|uniref:Uncharacterized protein n=1 Tax=Zea mays TaxID=4577 RepID=C4J0B5_MAIZE|nr:unknown [Zea mays]